MAGIRAREFFRHLWGDCQGWVELRLLRPVLGEKRQRPEWSYYQVPDQIGAFVAAADGHDGKWNVHFAPAVRRRPEFDPSKGKYPASTKDDVVLIPALWAEWDIKDPKLGTREKTVEAMRRVVDRVPPSFGWFSGGGFQVVWLLREPCGREEIPVVEAIHRAFCRIAGADKQSVDASRFLRVPETTNIKYSNRPMAEFRRWDPGKRYNLEDFDELVTDEDRERAQASAAAESGQVNPVVDAGYAIPPPIRSKLTKLLAKMWIEGYRNKLSWMVSGMMHWAGFAQTEVELLVQEVCDEVGDEEADARVKNVGLTYRRSAEGKRVAGAPSIEEWIRELPDQWREEVEKTFKIIKASIKQASREGVPRDVQLILLEKFAHEEAQWRLHLKLKEQEYEVLCGTDALMSPPLFRKAFADAYMPIFPNIGEAAWHRLLSQTPATLHEIRAPERTVKGHISELLDEFEEKAQKNEKIPHQVIEATPLEDESGTLYIKLGAFEKFCLTQGVKFKRRQAIDVLYAAGYERPPESVRLKGNHKARVWTKKPRPNGQPPKDGAQGTFLLKGPQGPLEEK